MDDAGRVRLRETLGDLRADLEKLLRRKRLRRKRVSQRFALDQLHDEDVAAPGTGRTGDFFE